MENKERKLNKTSKLLGAVILILVIILGGKFFENQKLKEPKVIESSAQVSSTSDKYYGLVTASKSWNESVSLVNVTGFLDKPKAGYAYYVYLKGNGSDLKDMKLGKMELSGDAFSLNYTSTTNLFAYKNLFVTLQPENNSDKAENTVLSGTFNK